MSTTALMVLSVLYFVQFVLIAAPLIWAAVLDGRYHAAHGVLSPRRPALRRHGRPLTARPVAAA